MPIYFLIIPGTYYPSSTDKHHQIESDFSCLFQSKHSNFDSSKGEFGSTEVIKVDRFGTQLVMATH